MDTTYESIRVSSKANASPSILIAIVYIFKKELTQFLRYPSWFVSMLIWPVLFPFGYVFTAKALSGPASSGINTFSALTGTTDYVSYMIIGTTMWMWVNWMLWGFGSSLRREQVLGTLESNWLCPIPKTTLLFGYSFFQLLYSFVFMGISLIEFMLFYNFRFTGNPLLALLIIVASIPSIYGIGFIFASIIMWVKEANSMVFLVRGVITVFCGITYPLAILPNWMKGVSSFIPVTYSIRSLRAVISAGARIGDVRTDIMILLLFGVILMTLGILAFNYTQKKVKETGSLGHY